MGLQHHVRSDLAEKTVYLPNHALVLLLSDIGRYFGLDLTCTERHSKCFCHIVLDSNRNRFVLVCWANPDISSSQMLELACSQLCNLCARY